MRAFYISGKSLYALQRLFLSGYLSHLIFGSALYINFCLKIKQKIRVWLENIIECAINKSLVEERVEKVIEKLSVPFKTSEQYETWFKMVPIELYVTEAKLSKSKITIS